MSDTSIKRKLLDGKKWIRILYIAFFSLLAPFLHLIMGISTLVQIILTLVNDKPNAHLQSFGRSYAKFYQQLVEFQLWANDHKPFPFDHWPAAEGSDARPKKATSSATPAKPKAAAKKTSPKTTKKAAPKKTTAAKPVNKKEEVTPLKPKDDDSTSETS